MFAYISGELIEKEIPRVVVDVQGIGYELLISLNTYEKISQVGEKTKLSVHTYVREDVLRLYGFHSPKEKKFFETMISISGIGPKVAISVLSTVEPAVFEQAIREGNLALLTKVPGIGKKTAERIVVELKDKISPVSETLEGLPFSGVNQVVDDVVLALISLGYKNNQAKEVVQKLAQKENIDELKMEEIVKKCLTTI